MTEPENAFEARAMIEAGFKWYVKNGRFGRLGDLLDDLRARFRMEAEKHWRRQSHEQRRRNNAAQANRDEAHD